MNSPKILEHLDAIRALLTRSEPTEADWAEYGRAVAQALGGYNIEWVSHATEPDSGWQHTAIRIWHAAGKVGLH